MTPSNSGEGDRIRTITGSTFESQVLNGDGPIAVEFMSYGCVHCRAIEPILQEVATMEEATEKFFRVNVAVELDLASAYNIQSTPTVVMFLNGSEVGRVEGPYPTVSSVMAAVTQPFEA